MHQRLVQSLGRRKQMEGEKMKYTEKSLRGYIKCRRETLNWYMANTDDESKKNYFKGCLDELKVLENDIDGLND